MDSGHEDSFVVFLRFDHGHEDCSIEKGEHALASCSTYEEATRIRRVLHGLAGDCVIRFVGTSGGGD